MNPNLANWMRWVVLGTCLLSLPALLPRIKIEHPGPVVLVMDSESVADEARLKGQTLEQKLLEYKAKGINGVGLYEQTVRGWFDQGILTYQSGVGLKLLYPNSQVKTGWYYVTGPIEMLEQMASTWDITTQKIVIGTQTWLGAPFDFGNYPAGFNLELARKLKADGFYVVARPQTNINRKLETLTFPAETDAIAFSGLELAGFPDKLDVLKQTMGGKAIALIEGTDQKGFDQLAKELPVLRLFSMKPEWLQQQSPAQAADRFLLASRERGHQLLYLRPFNNPAENEQFLQILTSDLERSHIRTGLPSPREFTRSPLRYAAWVGIIAGLVLLAIGLPHPIGIPVTVLLALFCLGAARSDAGPLLAAVVFPVLGFLENRAGLQKWVAAVVYALIGVVFLAALGSRTETVLTLQTFRGVSLTLIVPPLLVALSFLPTDYRGLVNRLYGYPLKLGDLMIGGLGLAIVALALLRRGNDANPAIVPDWEISLRQTLQDIMVRPRFKEIFGHAMAPLAFLLPWPQWIKVALTVLVSVGVSSIMNTFSHYHTPLSISFFRVLNGIIIGIILGFIVLWLFRRVRKWWLG